MRKRINTLLQLAGALFLLLVIISLFSRAVGQQVNLHLEKARMFPREKTGYYELFNPTKLIGWGVVGIAGFADGAVEGYEFDGRTAFEKGWGKSPTSFWGSESWRMIYNDGDPAKGEKSAFAAWLGAKDFYHTADDVRKYGYMTGSIVIGIGGKKMNAKWWHYAVDAAIGFGVSAMGKNMGMNWIRVDVPNRRRR